MNLLTRQAFQDKVINISSGSSLDTKAVSILDFGAVSSSDTTYDSATNTYKNMTDCTNAFKKALASNCSKIVFPSNGNFLINSVVPNEKKGYS